MPKKAQFLVSRLRCFRLTTRYCLEKLALVCHVLKTHRITLWKVIFLNRNSFLFFKKTFIYFQTFIYLFEWRAIGIFLCSFCYSKLSLQEKFLLISTSDVNPPSLSRESKAYWGTLIAACVLIIMSINPFILDRKSICLQLCFSSDFCVLLLFFCSKRLKKSIFPSSTAMHFYCKRKKGGLWDRLTNSKTYFCLSCETLVPQV